MTTHRVSHCCRTENVGSPPNNWDWISSQQPIMSCFCNWEGRATEEEPDPGVDSEAPQGRQREVSHYWPSETRDFCSWTLWKIHAGHLHSLPSFTEGAKHAGKKNGKLQSQVTPFKGSLWNWPVCGVKFWPHRTKKTYIWALSGWKQGKIIKEKCKTCTMASAIP